MCIFKNCNHFPPIKECLMNRLRAVVPIFILLITGFIGTAHALFGVGVHYSLDFSVNMDALNEQLTLDELNLKTDGFVDLPTAWTSELISPQNIPVFFDRGEMLRTPFGIGGKIYIDIIPILDCIEIGGGFTSFQYDNRIIFPSSITVNGNVGSMPPDSLLQLEAQDLVSIVYDTLSTNIEDIDGAPKIPGISKTPYAKLNLGLTIRKYIPIPLIDKVFRPYGGLGFALIFATPIPGSGLINDAIGDDLSGDLTVDELQEVLSDPSTGDKIITTIMERLMTPHFGMDIVVGFMLKPPVVPLGLYVDGKYTIPFGELDEDANVTGYGFRINAGLCLHIGKEKT